jgi:hypothetical protein
MEVGKAEDLRLQRPVALKLDMKRSAARSPGDSP